MTDNFIPNFSATYLLMGHPNWHKKMKPERSQAEQRRNATVQNDEKRKKAE
jgi:hypothetical protein